MRENDPYDLIIIGAGPAGSSLARLAAQECPGLKILLLEKRRLEPDTPANDKSLEKCCGGLLAPDAAKMLKKMRLAPPEHLFQSRQPLMVRALDLQSGQARAYPRPYGNLDRLAFERWLLSLLPPQVDFRPGRACRSFERREGLWEVKSGGELWRGRLLVGADGAASRLRSCLRRRQMSAPKSEHTLYLAVQDSFPTAWRSDEHIAFFHPGLTDFYGWVIPKQNETLLGMAMPLGQARPGAPGAQKTPGQIMAEARALLAAQGYSFDGKATRRACLLLRPGPADLCLGGNGAFCIGEAAGWISPSSAEGFSYAFASARALAKSLNREYHRPQKRLDSAKILAAYRRATFWLRLNIAWKSLKARVMYSPALRGLIMRSGLGAR